MIKRNLPQGWEIKTLGEVCEKVQKCSKDYKGLEFDYIDISSINNKAHTIEKIERYNVANAPSRAQQIVQSNDILFSNVRTYLKNIAFVNEKYNDCIASTGFCVIRTKKDILLPKFMFYQALSNEFVFSLNKLQRGSSYPAVRNSDIFMQNIVIPPLETQQKIVAKLESEFAKIESAKSHLEKVKETIPRLKNSLLKSAFSGELTQSYKDKKGAPYRHCEDSSESEAHNPQGFCPHVQIHNAQSPLKDSIAESKAYKIVDCHELRCNSCNDESIARIPSSTQAPNLGGATLVAQNPQNTTNPPDCHFEHSEETHKESSCHSEALAEESQNIKPHKDSTLKDISATPQYDKTISICHSDLECNEREESKRYFANAQYDKMASSCHSEGDKPEESHIADSNRDISHFSNAQYDKENNLPQGWEIKTLRDILSSDKYAIKRGPFGSMLKKEFFVDSGIRVFEQYNPINQDSNWKRYFVTQQKFKELESFKAGAGDLLISCSGTLGKILELPKGVEVGIINQALLKIRLDDKQILNSYFVYLFNSPYMQKIILENTIGSAIQNIASVKALKQIQIPLPPLQTQKQIVEILDSKFAALENLERETNASLEKLQRLKSSFLNLAFKGELIC